jgi:hypothetical protein
MEADAILRCARYDSVSGAKKDQHYNRKKRAEARWLARRRAGNAKRLGKLGAASPVRIIAPRMAEK